MRAVVEGVAHNLAWLLPHVEAFTGEADRARSRSSAARRGRAQWCQVLADVLDRPVVALAAPDGGDRARRPALLALERHGVHRRAPTSTAPRRRRARVTSPIPRHRALYADRQVQFEAAYAALLPISEALSHELVVPVRHRPTT